MYWNLKAFFFSTEEKEILYLMNIGWTKKNTQYCLEKKMHKTLCKHLK